VINDSTHVKCSDRSSSGMRAAGQQLSDDLRVGLLNPVRDAPDRIDEVNKVINAVLEGDSQPSPALGIGDEAKGEGRP